MSKTEIEIINTGGSTEIKTFRAAYQYKQAVAALEQLEALGFIEDFYNL